MTSLIAPGVLCVIRPFLWDEPWASVNENWQTHTDIMRLKGQFFPLNVDASLGLMSNSSVSGSFTERADFSCCKMLLFFWHDVIGVRQKKTTSYLSLDFASGQPGGMLLHRNTTCSPACKRGASTENMVSQNISAEEVMEEETFSSTMPHFTCLHRRHGCAAG